MLTEIRKFSVFNGFAVLFSGFDSRIPLQIKKSRNLTDSGTFLFVSMQFAIIHRGAVDQAAQLVFTALHCEVSEAAGACSFRSSIS